MDTNYGLPPIQHHKIEMIDRKNLSLTGIKTIESFDSQEFLVETVLGYLLIRGTGLSLGKMDTDNGELTIKGIIDSVAYVSGSKSQKEPLVKRLFK